MEINIGKIEVMRHTVNIKADKLKLNWLSSDYNRR